MVLNELSFHWTWNMSKLLQDQQSVTALVSFTVKHGVVTSQLSPEDGFVVFSKV